MSENNKRDFDEEIEDLLISVSWGIDRIILLITEERKTKRQQTKILQDILNELQKKKATNE